MSLLRGEHILDDAIEASIPDAELEMRRCAGCLSMWPKDDTDENGLCPECHDYIEGLCK